MWYNMVIATRQSNGDRGPTKLSLGSGQRHSVCSPKKNPKKILDQKNRKGKKRDIYCYGPVLSQAYYIRASKTGMASKQIGRRD